MALGAALAVCYWYQSISGEILTCLKKKMSPGHRSTRAPVLPGHMSYPDTCGTRTPVCPDQKPWKLVTQTNWCTPKTTACIKTLFCKSYLEWSVWIWQTVLLCRHEASAPRGHQPTGERTYSLTTCNALPATQHSLQNKKGSKWLKGCGMGFNPSLLGDKKK